MYCKNKVFLPNIENWTHSFSKITKKTKLDLYTSTNYDSPYVAISGIRADYRACDSPAIQYELGSLLLYTG